MSDSVTGSLAFMVPAGLAPRTRKVVVDALDLMVDIGFHSFEIGVAQRLRISVEVWLDAGHFPDSDEVDAAWDYDSLRRAIIAATTGRRFNLQETVAHVIYDLVAARRGVTALRVSTRKPDIYADCAAVGVELASF